MYTSSKSKVDIDRYDLTKDGQGIRPQTIHLPLEDLLAWFYLLWISTQKGVGEIYLIQETPNTHKFGLYST